MSTARFQTANCTALSKQIFEAGRVAGQEFQERFDRTGGRERKLPEPPYEDEALKAVWQTGFDFSTESARLEMTCADCAEDLELYEEQVCTKCLEKREDD